MTADEAERGAIDRHEFRHFQAADNGKLRGVCWCGATTVPLWDAATARQAHSAHQINEAIQRSFEPRRHV